ncbi:DUF427-domain-containing protein [Xylona heveae TC161]|uniref:DUF427-domain-containing protein n=1 Tax=Xylona heveae (strain CBS 132557 / TC161) TaxID=1328760 RepID=A0A165FQ68_XYLHT|nr:DUF427-domain-containing protein [Xylona heveae TC161]KZF21246.1 DUF427-domain-containing protein [Xylona heveae TC161]
MPHAVAKVHDRIVAETDKWEFVEGNIYFPKSSIQEKYFTGTDTKTFCPWKGEASYYDINVDGTVIKDAAWYYPTPKDKAQNIKDHVAFYKTKVSVTSD